jgi:hypothetical protein
MRNTADVTGGKPIAVLLQSISGVSAINPLVAFYDIHGGKREVLFFYFVPDTTRDLTWLTYNILNHHYEPNVPTVGAQAFLMGYTLGEWAITHHAGPVRVGGC